MKIRDKDLQGSPLDTSTGVQTQLEENSDGKGTLRTSMHWYTRMWEHIESNIILPALQSVLLLDREHNPQSKSQPTQSRVSSGDCNACSAGGVEHDDKICDCNEIRAKIPLQFSPVFDGVLLSVPGADTQHWHRDSGLHTTDISHYSVYISTANVTRAMGPTEFLPGTNRDFSFPFEDWTSFFDHCPTVRAPLLTAGI